MNIQDKLLVLELTGDTSAAALFLAVNLRNEKRTITVTEAILGTCERNGPAAQEEKIKQACMFQNTGQNHNIYEADIFF
jgi:hypothetical protein